MIMFSLLCIYTSSFLSFVFQITPLEAMKADGAGNPVTGINRAAERVHE